VEVWRKLRLFGLGYVRVDVWGKFIEIGEWCDGCKYILIIFNDINCKITNLSLCIKK